MSKKWKSVLNGNALKIFWSNTSDFKCYRWKVLLWIKDYRKFSCKASINTQKVKNIPDTISRQQRVPPCSTSAEPEPELAGVVSTLLCSSILSIEALIVIIFLLLLNLLFRIWVRHWLTWCPWSLVSSPELVFLPEVPGKLAFTQATPFLRFCDFLWVSDLSPQAAFASFLKLLNGLSKFCSLVTLWFVLQPSSRILSPPCAAAQPQT